MSDVDAPRPAAAAPARRRRQNKSRLWHEACATATGSEISTLATPAAPPTPRNRLSASYRRYGFARPPVRTERVDGEHPSWHLAELPPAHELPQHPLAAAGREPSVY